MPSGIYKLTFVDNSFYIGKSISISNRWKQHFDKFIKGKAASNMQQAYDNYGAPSGEIIFRCHKDHIDIAEELFIHRLKPPLNGTYPEDPFIGFSSEQIQEMAELLTLSTVEHIKLIKSLTTNKHDSLAILKERDDEIKNLEEMIDRLLVVRSQREINEEYINKIKTLNQENQALRAQLVQAKLPWWKRWFK